MTSCIMFYDGAMKFCFDSPPLVARLRQMAFRHSPTKERRVKSAPGQTTAACADGET